MPVAVIPYPGEETEAAAQRRLKEEMGFKHRLKKFLILFTKQNLRMD